MTARRLLLAAATMSLAAVALRGLTGPWPAMLAALASAPRVNATDGPEQVVLAAAGLLAWAAWAWGALGLLLTAVSAAPGLVGLLARALSRLVLPAGLRTASGLALGVGLVVATPAAAADPAPASAAAAVADWPEDPAGSRAPAPPDWPSAQDRAGEHVVVSGDCLWRIAEDRLLASGDDPTDADVTRSVARWWSANAAVIGPDPDLLRPGQVLSPPSATPPPTDQPYRSAP